jgi:hypothetical protein
MRWMPTSLLPSCAAELHSLSHDQLVRLAVELRQRMELLDEEFHLWGRHHDAVTDGLNAQVHRAMVELRDFLLFLEARVLRHRLRLRRAGQAPESARQARSSKPSHVA